jgi:hypothetical protein
MADDEPDDEPGDGTVVYDLSEWEADQVDTLEWAIGREGVQAVLRDRELTIREEDEGRVDLVIEQLFEGADDVDPTTEDTGFDDAGLDDAGLDDAGLDDMSALGDLFVAADRLMHRGDDPVIGAEFEQAVVALAGRPIPYGFEVAVWARITTMASWLVDELDGATPELIEAHAATLRRLLRQYV